jgi:MYND finger
MDDSQSNTPRDLWNLFFDLYIDSATLALIRQQSEKLLTLSKSMNDWATGQYGDCLRIINTETLNLLRHYWQQYSEQTPDAISKDFKASVKVVYERNHQGDGNGGFCRSAGPHAMTVQVLDPDGDWALDAKRYWKTGSVDFPRATRSTRPHCNPLFIYSQAGGSHLSMRTDQSPMSGFHLGMSMSTLTLNRSYYYETLPDDSPLENAVKSAKVQFQSWCDSFRRLVCTARQSTCNHTALRIRFIVADAISFCIALNQRGNQELGEIANRYCRPGSAKPLQLDGDDHLENSQDAAVPSSFDVVDTSFLVDCVGFLSLIPYVVPLFASNASILYTNTILSDGSNEKHMLSSMLCTADHGMMCALVGIAPTAYISGITTRGYHQDNATADDDKASIVISRITWRPTTSADSRVDVSLATPMAGPKALAKFLGYVFVRMLATRIQNVNVPIYRAPNYTVAGFAVFLRFLKQRVIVDWEEVFPIFRSEVIFQPGVSLMWEELMIYCYLFGICHSTCIDEVNSRRPSPLRSSGVLAQYPLPEVLAAVITIPRECLDDLIYDQVYNDGEHICIRFWLYFTWEYSGLRHTFMCAQPVFGKLVATADGERAIIEEDDNGWHGSSDLHLCTYFPTALLFAKDCSRAIFQVRLSQEKDTRNAFIDTLGPQLELYDTDFDGVQFFSSLPGLKSPSPDYPPGQDDDIAVLNDDVSVTFPRIDFSEKTFTTRIQLEDDSEHHRALKEKAEIKISQISPCAMTATYSTFQHVCNYPFPVSGHESVRVSRASGWIEFIVPLLSPKNRHENDRSSSLLPLFRRPDTTISTWNLPYINFFRLPKLDLRDPDLHFWAHLHLLSMFSDKELTLRGKSTDLLTDFKNTIHAMLLPPNSGVFRLKTDNAGNDTSLLFLVRGLYLELNSHSIVGEVYLLPPTSILAATTPESSLFGSMESAPPVQITITDEVMKLWKSSLPAMAERCRDWEHTESCEYRRDGHDFNIEGLLCSCGKGKVDAKCWRVKNWDDVKGQVSKIAVSPLFVAPYLEFTRGFYTLEGAANLKKAGMFNSLMPITDQETQTASVGGGNPKCKACGKAGTKKCAKCREVSYCSRECQTRDWPSHKKSCKASAS